MMKKISILLSAAMAHLYFGQNLDEGFSKPEASVASLSTYVNTPVSYATGIPNISFPLTSLPTHSKDVNINIALSYHPGNMFSDDRASEAGLGWTVLGANAVISREIINGTDERFYKTDAGNYNKNPFDDIYYYSFGGQSGKFRFVRDTVNNTFEIVKLTPSNVKIEYVREANNATLLLQSFKITDDKGTIYLFDVNSRAANKFASLAGVYKSAFYLTKVYNNRMQELYAVEYQIENKSAPQAYPQEISQQTCKVKKITSRDYGTIDFDYVKELVPQAFNDPYKLTTITVRNKAGDLMNKYAFVYNMLSSSIIPGKRILTEIIKYDRSLSKTETTAFEYNRSGSPKDYGPIPGKFKDYFVCDDEIMHFDDPKYFPFGTLKRVKLPTGGVVEYNFETKEYAVEDLSNYIAQEVGFTEFSHPQFQYLKPVLNVDFDTHLASQFSFTASPNATLYARFRKLETYPHPFDPNADPGLDYSIASSSGGAPYIGDQLCVNEADLITTKKYYPDSGNYTLKILSPTGGRGTIDIYEIALKTPPYKNALTDKSLRIESIRYFENAATATPAKTETFVYDRFDDANTSSGDPFFVSTGNGESISNPIYKNLKVLNGQNGGYTKYYFKTPSDYPETQLGNFGSLFWPHLNITTGGLLAKKEVYNAQNVLKASENHEYTLQSTGTVTYRNEGHNTLTSFIKNHTVDSKVFDSGQRGVTTRSETSVSESGGLSVEMQKTTQSDGSITETRYKYSKDTNHTALIAANMVTVPLQTEIKRDGMVIAKNETKYDNAQQLYPTSVLSYLPDDQTSSLTAVKYDIYDDSGNLVQYTATPDGASNGAPVTIIWGYNKTMPIAKIEGARLSDIPQNLITAIINASNEDADAAASAAPAKETALLAQLESFKNNSALSGFIITAYTYDPMVGVTNVLPPNGIREMYIYDSFNRLEKVRDANGNTLKEYGYHYQQ